jgi:mono/diheme cytochrome c family protein
VARKLPGSKRGISLLSAVLLACAAQNSTADCPQQRSTIKAPDDLYGLSNPQRATAERIALGRKLYEKAANPACEVCHGLKGDGNGTLATQFLPRPRNFACAEMLGEIPDGQLFWIIRNGSPDTAMPAYKKLTDAQIWQIILYLRTLAKPK